VTAGADYAWSVVKELKIDLRRIFLLSVTVAFDNYHGFISEEVEQMEQLRVTVERLIVLSRQDSAC
jgi:hypothetical protein